MIFEIRNQMIKKRVRKAYKSCNNLATAIDKAMSLFTD